MHKTRHFITLFLLSAFLITLPLFAAAYHLEISWQKSSPEFVDLEVQVKSDNPSMKMGSGNLFFTYDPDALVSPVIVSGQFNNRNYAPVTLTMPFGPGSISLNFELESPGNGFALSDEYQTVATLRFAIKNAAADPGFRWQTGDDLAFTTVLFSDDESTPVEIAAANISETANAAQKNPALPEAFKLYQNYPNPFNPATTIRFAVPSADASSQRVQLTIFDARGAKVSTLLDDNVEAGVHEIRWNGRNDRGASAGSGVYFLQMRTGNFIQTRRMILMR